MDKLNTSNNFKKILKNKLLLFKKKYNRIPKLETLLDLDNNLYTEDEEYINQYLKPLYKDILKTIRIDNYKDSLPKLILRDYQKIIITKILDNLKNDNTRTMLVAPTGSGKTKMAFVTMSKLIKNKSMLYVFVSPLLRINKQCLKDTTILINTDFNKSDNLNKFIEIEVNSTNKNYLDLLNKSISNNKNIILSTTYKSLSKIFNLIKTTNQKIDLLILDECHVIPSYIHKNNYFNSLKENNNNINNNNDTEITFIESLNIKKIDYYNLFYSKLVNKRLFVTATPYDYQKNNILMYGNYIEDVKPGDLIKQGYLANIETFLSKCKLIDNKNNDINNNFNDIIDINDTTTDINTNDTTNNIIDDYKKIPDIATSIIKFSIIQKRYRVCVFVNRIENGKLLKTKIINSKIYKQFNDTHVEIKIMEPILYAGNEKTKTINKFVDKDKFNNNEIRIIISCKKLSMGIDIPCIDSIIFADPRMNMADISQCVGRGLRTFMINNEIKICKILLLDYPRQNKNDMICAYLNYLKNSNIVYDIKAKIKTKSNNTLKIIKDYNNHNNIYNKFDIKKLNIYDGNLNIDIDYFEEYSTFIRENNKVDEVLRNYRCAKQQYEQLKELCLKNKVTTINDYLRLIGTIQDKEIKKITNPQIYFKKIKIHDGYNKIWHCWYHLFSIDYSLMPKSYLNFDTKLCELGLFDIDDYYEYCDKYKDMPKQPKYLFDDAPELSIIFK